MHRLLEIGFVQAGAWSLAEGKLELTISLQGEQRNVLYSFVEDSEIRYNGKSTRTLQKGMHRNWKPTDTQRTNVSINATIVELLNAGRSIEILVLPNHGMMHSGRFHPNFAAGLEDSLISKKQPPWKGGKKAKTAAPEPPVPVTGTFKFQIQPTYCSDSEVLIKALIDRRLDGNNTATTGWSGVEELEAHDN